MFNPRSPTEALSVTAADGTALSVYRDGPARPRSDGATIVLVHGASVTADLWRLHVRHLTGLGFTVLRHDQRAHGHTPRGEAPLTVEQLADDLHHILDVLAPTGPLVLAGHSLGALVLQELTAAHPQLAPRIRGMVLLSATAHGTSVLTGRSPHALLLAASRSLLALTCTHAPRAVDRVRRRLPDTHPYALTPRAETRADGGPPPCRDGVRHTLTTDLAALWQSLRHYRARHLPVLEQLGGQLLLMAGSDDRHIPAAHTAELADRLPGARLEVLPRTTHRLPIRHHALISARIARIATGPHPGVRSPKDPPFPNLPLSEPFH